jgi:HTH-type transcriptional regulator, cell division transcriptional repressor
MSKKIEISDPKSSPAARGRRLKTARMMTGLTRNGLEEKYNISASTIQSWEAAKAGGLTERGVSRMLPVLHQEGITCTVDWLLYGIGSGPQPTSTPVFATGVVETTMQPKLPDEKAVIQELLTFRKLNPHGIDLVLADDGMGPQFMPGDYIAGIRRIDEKIATVIGLDCIVQTSHNDLQFRRVKKSTKPGLYNLICTNPETSVFETTLYDQELISAAPIVWHRRCDTYKA